MLRPNGVLGKKPRKEVYMADVSSRNLQVRLLILVFLAFIPALGIFWYANRELRDLQLEAKEQELVQRAREVATRYRHLIDQGETLLATLAEFPEIGNARSPGCTELLARVLQHTENFSTIYVIGMDGNMACGSLTSENALYLGDRAYFIRATSTNRFSVGEFARGRLTGKPILGMAMPLEGGGGAGALIGASIDLNALGDHRAGGTPLPEGHTFSVLDLNRRVLVRLPLTGDFTQADSVGSIAGPDFPGPPEGSAPEVVGGTDLDGMERLFAVVPLLGPSGPMRGYLAIGRTRVTLMHEVDEIVNLQLRILALGGIVLLALAWILGHFWLARCPPGQEEN